MASEVTEVTQPRKSRMLVSSGIYVSNYSEPLGIGNERSPGTVYVCLFIVPASSVQTHMCRRGYHGDGNSCVK